MTTPDFTDAPCRDDPDLHFPATAGHSYSRQVAAAKAVCATCPVVLQKRCLDVAMTERDRHGKWYSGVWAGLTAAERDELRKKRAA